MRGILIDVDDMKYRNYLKKQLIYCILYVIIITIGEWLIFSSKLSLINTAFILFFSIFPITYVIAGMWKSYREVQKIVKEGQGHNWAIMTCKYYQIRDGFVYEKLEDGIPNENGR